MTDRRRNQWTVAGVVSVVGGAVGTIIALGQPVLAIRDKVTSTAVDVAVMKQAAAETNATVKEQGQDIQALKADRREMQTDIKWIRSYLERTGR